jgi:hypothetical protein
MKNPLSFIPYWPLLTGPALFFGIGFAMNAIVMAANHGQMPVLWPGGCPQDGVSEDVFPIHACMSAATHLKFLADWIVIRGLGVTSPGDFFEWLSDATLMPALYMWLALVIRDKHVPNYDRKAGW